MKTIKEVIKEFRDEFGEMEIKVTAHDGSYVKQTDGFVDTSKMKEFPALICTLSEKWQDKK